MSTDTILDEIRRLKNSVKTVNKKSKQKDQLSSLKKTLSDARQHLTKIPISQSKQLTKSDKSKQISHSSSCSKLSQQNQSDALFPFCSSPSPCQPYSFHNKQFLFLSKDINLTSKRIQIFQKIIKKHDGKILTLQQAFLFSTQNQGFIDYVIISNQMRKEIVLKKLQRKGKTGNIQRVRYQFLLDYHYIIQCQKQNKQISINPYILFSQDQNFTIRDDIIMIGQPRKLRHISQQITDIQNQQQESKLSSTQSLQIKNISRTSKLFENIKKPKNQKTQTLQKQILKFQPQNSKQKFACQKGSSSSQFPMNKFIYQQLMKFYNIYQADKDTGRKIAYLKAASAIKSYHKQIQSEKDIQYLRGIGPKITSKLRQLFQTGQIQKLQSLSQRQQTLICQQLSQVWGIGTSTAHQLFEKGIYSIQMLRQKQDLLSKNQRIGLKYHQNLQVRIPREKVTKIYQFVRQRLFGLVGSNDLHLIQVCGSYRRGKDTCGDVDIIIARKDGVFQQDLLIDLIATLQKQGFLTDHLQIPSAKQCHSQKSQTYMGICLLPSSSQFGSIHHRLDLKYYSISHYPFALLYFTGSDMFNRSMRLFARRLGYSLSDHGLVPVERGEKGKIWKGKEMGAKDERQIFQMLGLEYREPKERDV